VFAGCCPKGSDPRSFLNRYYLVRRKGDTLMTSKTEVSKRVKVVSDATILFADMVDSSMLSHICDPVAYDRLVSSFQEMCVNVVREMLVTNKDKHSESHIEASVRGDELSLIITCDPFSKKSTLPDVRLQCSTWLALQVAIRLKRHWLLVEENKSRICNGQPPLGIAIGLHAGPVIVRPHLRFASCEKPLKTKSCVSAEGYAINIAKRVETASRGGRFSRIYLTRPIYNRTPADFRQAFVRVVVPELKGIPVAPIIYEAKGIGHFDDKSFPKGPEFESSDNLKLYNRVVTTNPDEVWLLLDLAHRYFDVGMYDEAAERYKLVIESDPEFPPAYAYLGRAHLRNYRFQEAHTALDRATDLDKEQARSNHFFAVCLRRQALFALHKEQASPRARDLFQRAINFHDKACRIAQLENMDFPWAQNGLNWTITQCEEFPDLSVPYDITKALESSRMLRRFVCKSPAWRAKEHLILHTIGFIRLKQRSYNSAAQYLQKALSSLDDRWSDPASAPDSKGYAERKAEILYHLGLCEYLRRTDQDLSTAIEWWRNARHTIEDAWDHIHVRRALEGQYWWYHRIKTGEEIRTIGSLTE
jgi:tetratricopeptide (TPR) repeat protein